MSDRDRNLMDALLPTRDHRVAYDNDPVFQTQMIQLARAMAEMVERLALDALERINQRNAESMRKADDLHARHRDGNDEGGGDTKQEER